ncbi:hypothetical protein F4823DRAFT_534804 [Ustulina deusta]|nr:hypothetical protein F4823DRAFT_534804 [Ustulina deusta]
MRPQLITLALTSGTLASTNSALRGRSAGNEDSSLQLRHESGLASREATLARRVWARRSDSCKGEKRRKWFRVAREKRKCCDGDDDSGSDSDCSKTSYSPSSPSSHESTKYPTPTASITTSIPSTVASTTSTPAATGPPPPPDTDLPSTSPTSAPSPSGSTSVHIADGPTSTPVPPQPNHDKTGPTADESNRLRVALGIVGGILVLSILSFLWYWVVIRPRRRDRLGGQRLALAKDADLESHVTVDLRSGLHTPRGGPRGPGSSSEGLSNYALSAVPPVPPVPAPAGMPGPGHPIVESAARSLSIPSSPGSAHAGAYSALQWVPMASSSPATSHGSFADAYATPHPAYGQAHHPQSYSPTGSPQRPPLPPVFPPQGPPTLPSPLHIGGASHMHPAAPPRTMELDGRQPPPRYPDAIATSEVPRGVSPTSPLPVSPLSVASRDEGAPHIATTTPAADESQYPAQQRQQYSNGPRQPSYGDYAPSVLPEVVSPICQLGQTSASPPEYDESAEAARSGGVRGANNHHGFPEDKQVLQQPMSRY